MLGKPVEFGGVEVYPTGAVLGLGKAWEPLAFGLGLISNLLTQR